MVKTITAIEPQKRNPDRCNVFIDETYAFSLSQAVAGTLRVGDELSDEGRSLLEQQELAETARQKAERFLSYRPRSVSEVRRRLQREGLAEDIVEAIVASLQQRRLLDDEVFARYWIEQRETFRPRSEMALSQELSQKGVSRAVIERALATQDDLESARRAARSRAHRWVGLAEEPFSQTVGGFLQRRGFPYSVCRQVVAELWVEIEANTNA